MKIINDISSQRFTLDGIEYLKNFLSRVYGNKITIYNAYDKDDVLIENELYTNVEVNGVVYGSAALLQQALLSVIYTRATLGGIVQDSPYFNYFNNIEGFSLVGQDLTINANWAWTIQGGANTNPSSVLINIPFAATGYHRIDIVVANANNGFDLIQGVEVLLANSPAEPSTPIATLKVTSLVVTDGIISSPELPITGTDFVKKTYALNYSYSTGTTNAVYALRENGASVYTLTNAGLVSVSGFDLSLIVGYAESPYSGKTIRLLNQTGNDITIKNFDDTNAEIPFYLKEGIDLVMPNNETIEFYYSGTELTETFRSWTESSPSTSTITRKTATSSNLSSQDLTGFLTYVNGVTSFAIAANEHVIYEVTDTRQAFLIYPNNRSVGSGQAALTSSEVLEIEKNFTSIKRNDFSILTHHTQFQPSRLVEVAGPLLTTTGTADDSGTGPSYAGNSFLRWVRRRYVSAGAAGSNVSHSTGAYRMIDNTSSGQFFCSTHVGNEDASSVATGRTFFGFYGSVSFPNVNPSTASDLFGLSNDSTDANMQIIHNDSSGSATKIDLGASFPANTVSVDHYLFQFWKYAGSTEIHYYVKNIGNGAEVKGKVTTNLPVSGYYTVILNRNNGSTASAVRLSASHLIISENK